ncbi:MAG TPA: hypothetical protein VGR52_03005 [Stellaceae bacterium]|nr:hypothetical protein [Stellaceae bacterium]
MMTLQELQKAKVNLTIAREAYDQAEKRLADTLETKKAFEQKATTLLGVYATISLALSGGGAALVQNPTLLLHHRWPIWTAAALMMVGAACFAGVMIDQQYGAIGSDPDMWLNSGTIDAKDDGKLAEMLALITFYHKKRISVGTRSNKTKACLIRAGVICGVAAPLVLLALVCAS